MAGRDRDYPIPAAIVVGRQYFGRSLYAVRPLKNRGEDPASSARGAGYGLSRHALFKDRDTRFWLDLPAREGKLKAGQFAPDDVATNRYSAYAIPAER